MWKFKTSKYKNAHPTIPKKEGCITNIAAANFLPSCGNHIAASAAYITFNTDAGGGRGCLGLLPLNARGRQPSAGVTIIHAHAEHATDFSFSPFDDYSLATCSQDGSLKIWNLPEDITDVSHVTDVAASIPVGESKVECLKWHPSAAGIIATGGGSIVKVYDLERSEAICTRSDASDTIQALNWHGDGSKLIMSSKDKHIRIIDPRSTAVAQETKAHDGNLEIRALWLGNSNYVLSTGCDMMRSREVIIRDVRNLSDRVCFLQLDQSTGPLMPFYDAERGMLFLAGKGDTTVQYFEFSQDKKTLTMNSSDPVGHHGQIKGFAMAPKRAVDVMACEVNHMLALIKNSILPLPICVPRKSYTEFHSDLFPDIPSGIPAMNAQQWQEGEDKLVTMMSQDPSTRPVNIRRQGATPQSAAQTQATSSSQEPPVNPNSDSTQAAAAAPPAVEKPPPPSSIKPELPTSSEHTFTKPALRHVEKTEVKPANDDQSPEEPTPPQPSVMMRVKKTANVLPGVRQSKFRHLKGTTTHKSEHIDNLRNVCKSIPGESDMFHTNSTFCAIPISGSGGLLAVHKVSSPGRLPDTGIPLIQNGSILMDFCFDPFDDHRIVTACDDAKIRVWTIPAEGLTETLTDPTISLSGHTEKLYFVKYHPLAKDVLASASYDMTVRIWDLSTGEDCIHLEGHTDTIFCLSWSPDGKYCVTVCKDGRVRLYNPRLSTTPLQEGQGPEGSRGARVSWVCDSRYIVVIGMDKNSCRTLMLFDPAGLATPVTVLNMSIEPSLLIPYYDEDSQTLFLTGRGDSTIHAFEVADEPPYFFPLADTSSGSIHQALAFLPKNGVDVGKVEFAKALRLMTNKVEVISFTVPRIKMEYFQDDLYPETKNTWEPVMTSEEWFAGVNRLPQKISMRPANMELLSNAPVEEKTAKYESYESYSKTYKTDEEKKEELLSAMNKKLNVKDEPLPQDLTEGVDEDEWSD